MRNDLQELTKAFHKDVKDLQLTNGRQALEIEKTHVLEQKVRQLEKDTLRLEIEKCPLIDYKILTNMFEEEVNLNFKKTHELHDWVMSID